MLQCRNDLPPCAAHRIIVPRKSDGECGIINGFAAECVGEVRPRAFQFLDQLLCGRTQVSKRMIDHRLLFIVDAEPTFEYLTRGPVKSLGMEGASSKTTTTAVPEMAMTAVAHARRSTTDSDKTNQTRCSNQQTQHDNLHPQCGDRM